VTTRDWFLALIVLLALVMAAVLVGPSLGTLMVH
jgi:hypothetical protein